jgi:protein-S-isoprenylcysteine O-methyltransferase Ste14
MTRIDLLAASSPMQIFARMILSALWLLFAVAHIVTFNTTGKASLLAFGVSETLVAFFFLARPPARTVTTNAIEWVIAILGTFLPLLVRPTPDAPIQAVELGLVLGSVLQIASVLSLNRSFALVPALREVKTDGMYRFVRHPIYFSYVVTFCCYLAGNFTIENLVVLSATIGLLMARVLFEERHLSRTPEYRAYRERVNWRLIPFVF